MKGLLITILLFTISCSPNTSRNDFNFSNKMSFEEVKLKLEEYSRINPYPNIDD